MNDTKSASLVLVVGAAGIAYWWYQINSGKLAAGQSTGGATGPPGEGEGKGPSGSPLARLEAFAREWGLSIGSGLRPGDTGSLHSEGRALDVGVPAPGIRSQVEAAAAALGIHILKEEYTSRPGDGRPRSTGPHWHLSFPRMKNGRLVW